MTRLAWFLVTLAVLTTAPAYGASPGVKHQRTPESLGLRYSAVRFVTPDSVRLSGWWFAGPRLADVVVVAPRGEGTMANLLDAVKAMNGLGFSVLTFDYRDFGPSRPGRRDSLRYVVLASHWVNDMVAALQYARSRVDSSAHVFAWGGHDLPSRVALAAAARDSNLCDALAIEGIQRNTDEIMRVNGTLAIPEAVRQQRGVVAMRDQPAAAVSNLKVPLLLLVGARDTITTAGATQSVVSSSRSRRDRMMFPEGGHTDLEQAPDYFDRMRAWFIRMGSIPRQEAEP